MRRLIVPTSLVDAASKNEPRSEGNERDAGRRIVPYGDSFTSAVVDTVVAVVVATDTEERCRLMRIKVAAVDDDVWSVAVAVVARRDRLWARLRICAHRDDSESRR